MIFIFGLFLLTLLVITAIAIVRTEDLFVAVMLTSIFSLLMAANFFILDAADVALTEAAVGAGVTSTGRTLGSFWYCGRAGTADYLRNLR
jgi:multicomponent Na+:H+ antiporter subunit B